MTTPVFNPFDPAFRANPYPYYDSLRTHEPVHTTAFGMVVLTRYEDVSTTLKSADFSRDIEKYSTQASSEARQARRDRQESRTKSILNLDPPDHTRLRRIVSKSFTPSAMERLRPRIQQLVDKVLDNAQDAGHIELIDDLAFPVPFQVISDLLDMPTERSVELREWSQIITNSLEPTATDEDLLRSEDAIAQLVPYLTTIIEHRRKHLSDDMLSSLITAEESGEQMTTEELMAFVVLLYIAGHETTVNLIGNGTLALLNNPEQQAIVHNSGLAQSHIDELLRFDGPVQHTVRVPLVPVHYIVDNEQITVQPGTMVLTSLGGANHDPSMFENPHDLQLNRTNSNRHMAFASGIHYCLGASLAKLETEIAVGSLIKRFAQIEIVGTPSWRDRLTIRGVNQLRLSVS
jgi:cytochrome P450